MSCLKIGDCSSMECSKAGSYMMCIDEGCACSLPQKIKLVSKKFVILAIILFVTGWIVTSIMQKKNY